MSITVAVGHQVPRIECAPPSASSSAADAIDLAAACGLQLDPWQEHVLRQALGEAPDGRWAAYDVGVVVARQNGKGAILMARELAGALLFGEKLIVHSAHELDTARDHLKKLDMLAEENPFLRAHLPADGIKWGRGYEEAKFANGAVIRFKSRTRKGGRGLTGDLVIFDEAFELEDITVGAMQPLLRARPNPQVWYASSVVDQVTMPHGYVLTNLRARAQSDDPGKLTYCEWSNPDDMLTDVSIAEIRSRIADPERWAVANPALGIRIDPQQIANEVDSMPLRQFAVECLSVGDWPDLSTQDGADGPIDLDLWDAAGDVDAPRGGSFIVGAAVSSDRARASVGAACRTEDGRLVVWNIETRPGKAWVAEVVRGLVDSGAVSSVVIDGWSDLERDLSFVPDLRITSASDIAAACARVIDAVNESTLLHNDQDEVNLAVEHVQSRRLAGGLAWRPPPDGTDVTPLGALTLACWGVDEPSSAPQMSSFMVL